MKKKSTNIVLASSAHFLNDDMICYRYGMSLAKYCKNIYIIGQKSEIPDTSMHFIELPNVSSRMKRFTRCIRYISKIVMSFKPIDTIVFIFTPDLLLLCPKLKRKGYRIVQVYMENYFLKIQEKKWIPRPLRLLVTTFVSSLQKSVSKYSFLNIFVDSITLEMQGGEGRNTMLLPNYPINRNHITDVASKNYKFPISIVYAGGLSFNRGLKEMNELIENAPKGILQLYLYGKCSDAKEQLYFDRMIENENIIYKGFVPYDQVLDNLGKYDVGIALYKKTKAYQNIAENTTKIFEYMEYGLPVITSDFYGLRKIINEDNVGINVNTDSDNWREQVYCFVRDLNGLKKLSINGIQAFEKKRNWNKCEKALIEALNLSDTSD